jgi:hypothetical protein
MPYNLLMPEKENHRSPQPWWLSVWQRRWWIALATLFLLVWWLVPPLLYRHTGTPPADKLKAITDTRTALLVGLAGLGALLTFWLNSREYRITARTLEVTEQGHITERYTRAIEQLGNNSLDVRLGGIFALERIAVDSERDHPTVVEVLSAFIREHSRIPTKPESWLISPPTTDVQAACTVLGRLPLRAGVHRGNLTGAHLAMANLAGAHLEGANLRGAHLIMANLWGAHLQKAGLATAHLEGANLGYAHLEEADLTRAHLEGAKLRSTHLERANLSNAMGLSKEQLNLASVDENTKLPWMLDLTLDRLLPPPPPAPRADPPPSSS